MSVSPARRAAFDILLELRQEPHSHSDQLLHSKPVDALSAADRNLATALVMGVLRWRIALDARIARHITAPRGTKRPLDAPIEVALELGALQLLLFDRIPAHAAIFESVELAKESGKAHAAGLVNAVLRKLQASLRHSPKLDAPTGPLASCEEIAGAWAHPLWLVERWVRAYGAEAAAAICRFDQYPPPTAIRLLAPQAEGALEREGLLLAPGVLVERARRVVEGDVSKTETFARGWVRIQDEGSQLIAELASRGDGASASIPASLSILDCCAAPGGKTAILAERNPQAPITACEIHPGRLKAMRSFLAKQGTGRISFRAVDSTTLDCEGQFDLVLLDAPCSGTGTLARNPEIRHRLTAEDLGRQQERQVRLCSSAMRSLAVGGQLVYSTCSLEAEENERVIHRALAGRQALAGRKRFRLLSGRDRIQSLEREGILRPGATDLIFPPGSPGNFLRTLPGPCPCDGFFAAVLKRES